jgi:hypothetical protein
MNPFRLVNPEEMLGYENKLSLTADVNHAMIEYGFSVKGQFLRWMVYGDHEKEKLIENLLSSIGKSLFLEQKISDELKQALNDRIEFYLENIPARRKIALSFILFNSVGFAENVREQTVNLDLTPAEEKVLLGREVEKELYVGGSYNLDQKVRDYLAIETCRFASELNFTSGVVSTERINEMLASHSKLNIAKFEY